MKTRLICSSFERYKTVSAMVGTARCAVPARVVAGGTNDRVASAIRKSCAAARGADIAAQCPYHAKQIPSRSEASKVAAGFSARVEFRKQPRRGATLEDRGWVQRTNRGTHRWRRGRGMYFQPNSGRQDARPLWQARRLPLWFSEEPYLSSDLPANPKGIVSSSQGCEARATLGLERERAPTPTGLCPVHRDEDTTPLGLTPIRRRFSKVARSEPDGPTSQPWALGRNPVGIRFSRESALWA